jgi:SOS-response transcriptional repressor LexA
MARDTKLRRKYLDYIYNYIQENHCAPRLEEIAQHFSVTEPTAHKMLSSLQEEKYLAFGRDDSAGFYIRVMERIGTTARYSEIVIVGGINRYGILHEFPKNHGHFSVVVPDYNPEKLFALQAWQHIPQADILANDLLIFDQAQEPKIGAMSVIPYSDDFILAHLVSQDDDGGYFWIPIGYDESNKEAYIKYFEKYGVTPASITQELIVASAIALKRILAI